MLIKVRDNLYLNSDHIVSIIFYDTEQQYALLYQRTTDTFPGPCAVIIASSRAYQISQESAQYILAMMDAKDALVTDGSSAPAQASLKSRLAVMLRDTWQGPTFTFLTALFEDDTEEIKAALNALIAEHVVVQVLENNDWHYYHASSAVAQEYLRWQQSDKSEIRNPKSDIFTPNPDPSSAGAAPPSGSEIPAGYSEQRVDQRNDD